MPRTALAWTTTYWALFAHAWQRLVQQVPGLALTDPLPRPALKQHANA